MTTRYQMKEMPDLQGTGEPITYPKMVMTGQTGTRELAEYIAMTSGFSKGVTEGVICELGEALAHEMGMGRSVKIEGLGVFTPALSIYPDKEREQPQESSTKRNARSIYVSGVNFRTDKALIRETNHWCELERASWKPAHSSKKYTPRTTSGSGASVSGQARLPYCQHLPATDRTRPLHRHRGTAQMGTYSRQRNRYKRHRKP